MSLEVKLDRVTSGQFIQVIGTLSAKIAINADQVASRMVNRWKTYTYEGWPVGPSRPGHVHSRDTIEEPRKLGAGHYQFRVTAPYAGIIEFGGFRLGPKTGQQSGTTLPGDVTIGGGIFAIQKPSAPLRRAESRMKLEMSQVLASQITQGTR